MAKEYHRCVIIGSGPAGYTAAIYASRANLRPVEYCGLQPGGQLTQTTMVDNFPGYPLGVDGNQMMMDLREQATRFGADLRDGEIVSACATCDGFFYRKKVVAVVGGGDTACEEATYLASLCSKVYMIVRKPFLRASDAMQRRVAENPKIEILFEHNAVGLYGENGVEGVHLVKRMGETDEERYDLPIDGFFLAIGHQPNSKVFQDYIDTDEQGYIRVDGLTQATKVPGVFAAGDVCDPRYRQAIIAAGSGAKAALDAEKYLAEIGK